MTDAVFRLWENGSKDGKVIAIDISIVSVPFPRINLEALEVAGMRESSLFNLRLDHLETIRQIRDSLNRALGD